MNVDLEHALAALVPLVSEHLAREEEVPVREPRDPRTLARELDLGLSEHGIPLDDVVERLRDILAATPNTASSRFFNQLYGGRDGAAVLGDLLATVLNTSLYTYKVGGVHVLIELELVGRMGRMVGFDQVEGVFTPGGSLSNLSGMLLARDRALPDWREIGPDGRVARVYTSEESHYSVRKAAAILGIGRQNLVRVPVDARGRMRPEALDAAIRSDLAQGFVPVMINATSGTTVLGTFDPLDAIADIAEAHGVWLHVDGAYGGSMLFHPELHHELAGIHRADSVTWDPHKMMGTPLTCSVFLCRHPGRMQASYNEIATYLFQDDTDDLNPGTRSIQCGRRNSALKLWTAWKTHGDAGYVERLVQLRDLAVHARDVVVADPDLTLLREPESLNVCFTVRGVDAVRLCTELNVEGRAMVSHADVDDQACVRLVFLDPRNTTVEIDQFFESVRIVAERLRREAA